MAALLRLELIALVNLFRFPDGRILLYAHMVTLSCIAAGGLFVGRATLASPLVLDALRDDESGILLDTLLGMLVTVPVALMASLAFAQSKRELFGPTSGVLLLSAPMTRGMIVAAAVLRIVLHGVPFGLALGLPLLLPMAYHAGLSVATVLGFVVSVVVTSIPAVAALLLVDVAMRRFLSGIVAKWVMAISLAALGFAGFFAMILGWGGSEAATGFVVDTLNRGTPWLRSLGAPGALPFAAMLALATGCILVTGRLYPRTYEKNLVDERAAGRGVRGQARWPRGVARSVFHREWLVLRQAPINLLFYLFIFVPIAWYARTAELPEVLSLPEPLQWARMLTLHAWWMVFLILSALFVASMATDDARQLDLLRSVPASRGALLRGRIAGLALPLLWTVVASVLSASLLSDAGALAILIHLGMALPMVALALGTIAGFGTFCTFIRGADGEETPSAVYMVGGIIAQMAIFLGLALLSPRLEHALREYQAGLGPFRSWSPTTLGAAFFALLWTFGFGGGWLAYRFGLRNYRKLLGPES